jgi:hypothetical protein
LEEEGGRGREDEGGEREGGEKGEEEERREKGRRGREGVPVWSRTILCFPLPQTLNLQ